MEENQIADYLNYIKTNYKNPSEKLKTTMNLFLEEIKALINSNNIEEIITKVVPELETFSNSLIIQSYLSEIYYFLACFYKTQRNYSLTKENSYKSLQKIKGLSDKKDLKSKCFLLLFISDSKTKNHSSAKIHAEKSLKILNKIIEAKDKKYDLNELFLLKAVNFYNLGSEEEDGKNFEQALYWYTKAYDFLDKSEENSDVFNKFFDAVQRMKKKIQQKVPFEKLKNKDFRVSVRSSSESLKKKSLVNKKNEKFDKLLDNNFLLSYYNTPRSYFSTNQSNKGSGSWNFDKKGKNKESLPNKNVLIKNKIGSNKHRYFKSIEEKLNKKTPKTVEISKKNSFSKKIDPKFEITKIDPISIWPIKIENISIKNTKKGLQEFHYSESLPPKYPLKKIEKNPELDKKLEKTVNFLPSPRSLEIINIKEKKIEGNFLNLIETEDFCLENENKELKNKNLLLFEESSISKSPFDPLKFSEANLEPCHSEPEFRNIADENFVEKDFIKTNESILIEIQNLNIFNPEVVKNHLLDENLAFNQKIQTRMIVIDAISFPKLLPEYIFSYNQNKTELLNDLVLQKEKTENQQIKNEKIEKIDDVEIIKNLEKKEMKKTIVKEKFENIENIEKIEKIKKDLKIEKIEKNKNIEKVENLKNTEKLKKIEINTDLESLKGQTSSKFSTSSPKIAESWSTRLNNLSDIPNEGKLNIDGYLIKGKIIDISEYEERIIYRTCLKINEKLYQISMNVTNDTVVNFFVRKGSEYEEMNKFSIDMETLCEKAGFHRNHIIALGAYVIKNMLVIKDPDVCYFDFTKNNNIKALAAGKILRILRGLMIRKNFEKKLKNLVSKKKIKLNGEVFTCLVYIHNEVLYLRLVEGFEVLGLDLDLKKLVKDGLLANFDTFYRRLPELGLKIENIHGKRVLQGLEDIRRLKS